MPNRRFTSAFTHSVLFRNSRFTWCKAVHRNQFVSFEQQFDAPGTESVWLHLFADTRFRIFVNGTFLAYGPARFVTSYPEYDSYDLRPLLKSTGNSLRVEVNYYGTSSYQSMPDGQPGFIADGGTADGKVSFATPGNWKVRRHSAWQAEAPHFSFAQNPAEVCDLRSLASELAGPSSSTDVELAGLGKPWGALRPRSVAYPDYAPFRPKNLAVAGRLRDRTQLLCVHTHMPMPAAEYHANATPRRRLLSWIHSPQDQVVSMDCLWADFELNGQKIARHRRHMLGNHETTRLMLIKGWNLLTAAFEILGEDWSFLLGYPNDAGLEWRSRPDLSCTTTFLASKLEFAQLPNPAFAAPDAFVPPADWQEDPGSLEGIIPARQMGWDQFDEKYTVRNLSMTRFPEVSSLEGKSVSWCFAFADQFYGHPCIDLDAPEGSLLDIAYDDWQRSDGAVNLYTSNPFTHAADRFVLPGGRTTIDVCNPRGGQFLQVTLRSPPAAAVSTFTIHDLLIRSRTTLPEPQNDFSCGNAVIDWACQSSLHTLARSTDESYTDCPWRERGSYIGDSYVTLHLNHLLTSDMRVARRSLALFGQAQMEDGQLLPVAPSWHKRPHPDFTLIWLLSLRDYWALTGDSSLLHDMWPRILNIWNSSSWQSHACGLWNAHDCNMFIDWGALSSEREGDCNAVLNIFRYAAAVATAEICKVIGRESDERRFAEEAAQTKLTIQSLLWSPQEARFLAALDTSTPAVHANILALLYGIGDADAIMAYLAPLLRANFNHGIEHGEKTGFAELYFFHYLLPALAKQGQHQLAEDLIEEHYGFLMRLGQPTLNECFSRAHRSSGSCCHSWSGAPAIYFARHILGISQFTPGQTDHYLLDPRPSGLTHASGKLPHHRGNIHLSWQKTHDGRIKALVEAPEGVRISAADHVDIDLSVTQLQG